MHEKHTLAELGEMLGDRLYVVEAAPFVRVAIYRCVGDALDVAVRIETLHEGEWYPTMGLSAKAAKVLSRALRRGALLAEMARLQAHDEPTAKGN